MSDAAFIRRVVLHDFKSIGHCDVSLRPLTYLVGQNGSGKSNFLDALHFVRDALAGSLDNAINERGGLSEVRRRSSGHPTHFVITLDFALPDGRPGRYGFVIGSRPGGAHEVQRESCAIGGGGPYFQVAAGVVEKSSESAFPAVKADRLALVAASGFEVFRPVFDALTSMGFYNLNPRLMRELQKPQDGRLLRPAGENIASVIGHLDRVAPDQLRTISEYLQSVVPMVHGLERKVIGPVETVEFRQEMAGSRHPWKFLAQNMSDGTLRALGVITALLQRNVDHSPLLIGIEEPETAIHPAASATLREVLVQASMHTQVLVTSHSPDLLDDPDIDAESIISVYSEEGETKLAPVDEGTRTMMRDHLFSAGDLLRIDQLTPERPANKKPDQPQMNLGLSGGGTR